MIHVEQEPGSEIHVPPAALWGAAALMVASLLLAGTARLTGKGTVGNPTAVVAGGVSFQLRFRRDAGDVVSVVDGRGRVLRTLAAGEGGFLRGVLRPLDRERAQRGVDLEAPYELRTNSAGTVTLIDPLTGVVVDVAAFGKTSEEEFQSLIPAVGTASP